MKLQQNGLGENKKLQKDLFCIFTKKISWNIVRGKKWKKNVCDFLIWVHSSENGKLCNRKQQKDKKICLKYFFSQILSDKSKKENR